MRRLRAAIFTTISRKVSARGASGECYRAGDIGMTLDTALNLFQRECVALMIIAIFAMVTVAQIVLTEIRKRKI